MTIEEVIGKTTGLIREIYIMKFINLLFFNTLTILSIITFLFFLIPSELYQNLYNKSIIDIILNFLISGISLVILSFYYFSYLKDWLDNLTGLVIVIFAVLIHIIISAFLGHAGNEILFIGYIFELIFSILIIYIYDKKFKLELRK